MDVKNENFKRAMEWYRDLVDRGIIVPRGYDIAPLDTIGRRLNEAREKVKAANVQRLRVY